MTHDELLEKIDVYAPSKVPVAFHKPYLLGLRAVVELHKPEHSIRGYRCTFDDELFPCKHHQAIEKELG